MDVFKKEKDLVDAFSINIKKFLRKILNKSINRYFVIKEFDSYIGIADLILGTYKPYLSKRTCREPINLNWIYPLIDFKLKEVISVDEFMDKYGVSKKSALSRLSNYTEASFLNKIDNYQYRVIKKYEFVTDNVVAVEAKLENWRRALFQANRYKKFSDFTYVLLDESYANSAISNIEEFKINNIGLITMNNSGFNIHYLSQEKNPKKENYFVRVNEAAYSNFSSTFMV